MEQNQQATIQYANQFSTIPDWDKFNTCKHRSETEQDYTVRTCCQSQQKRGFICYKIPLNGVTPNHCKDCPVYAKKENV